MASPSMRSVLAVLVLSAGVARAGELVKVSGTQVWMVPPPGFEPSSERVGFKHPNGAVISVMEMPAPFSQLRRDFPEDKAEAAGLRVLERRALKVDGVDAELRRAIQPEAAVAMEQWVLIFGDEKASVMVVGAYLPS